MSKKPSADEIQKMHSPPTSEDSRNRLTAVGHCRDKEAGKTTKDVMDWQNRMFPQVSKNEFSKLFKDGKLDPNMAKFISPPTGDFNCIAHSVGDHEHWFDPKNLFGDDFNKVTDFYGKYGYQSSGIFSKYGLLGVGDTTPINGMDKVMVFADDNGNFTHAAVSYNGAPYSSKMGTWGLTNHNSTALNGPAYGHPAAVFTRPHVDPLH